MSAKVTQGHWTTWYMKYNMVSWHSTTAPLYCQCLYTSVLSTLRPGGVNALTSYCTHSGSVLVYIPCTGRCSHEHFSVWKHCTKRYTHAITDRHNKYYNRFQPLFRPPPDLTRWAHDAMRNCDWMGRVPMWGMRTLLPAHTHPQVICWCTRVVYSYYVLRSWHNVKR